jgi:hypothetical protein
MASGHLKVYKLSKNLTDFFNTLFIFFLFKKKCQAGFLNECENLTIIWC